MAELVYAAVLYYREMELQQRCEQLTRDLLAAGITIPSERYGRRRPMVKTAGCDPVNEEFKSPRLPQSQEESDASRVE